MTYWAHMDPARRNLHGDWHYGEGAWLNVGVHMRWQPGLVKLADDMLRDLFGLWWNEEIPTYMAIHIRRGDFNEYWKKLTPRQYAYRAWEVMNEAKKVGIHAQKVIVTTDEQDPEWLDQLRAYGLIVVDHVAAQTGEKLGWWFPTLLDAIMLSKAHVFLGNPSSTSKSLIMDLAVCSNAILTTRSVHPCQTTRDRLEQRRGEANERVRQGARGLGLEGVGWAVAYIWD